MADGERRADQRGETGRQLEHGRGRARAERLPAGLPDQLGVAFGDVGALALVRAERDEVRGRVEQREHLRPEGAAAAGQDGAGAAFDRDGHRGSGQAADQERDRQCQPGGRVDEGEQQHRARAHARRDDRGQQHAGHQVADGVGVVDQPLEGVAAQPGGAEPHQRLPQPDSQVSREPERGLVRHEPFQVAQHALGQRERPHADHEHGQREDRWLLGGAGDQVGGQRAERHAAAERRDAERGSGERSTGEQPSRFPHPGAVPVVGSGGLGGHRFVGVPREPVRREDDGDAGRGGPVDGGHHQGRGRRVEVRGRLVEQQHPCPGAHLQEGSRHGHALALTCGQLVDAPVVKVLRRDLGQLRPFGPAAEDELQLLDDRRPRERGPLRHPGDDSAPSRQIHSGQVVSADQHLTGVRPHEPEQHRHRRRLPRPARPVQPVHLPRAHHEAQPVRSVLLAPLHVQIPHVKHGVTRSDAGCPQVQGLSTGKIDNCFPTG